MRCGRGDERAWSGVSPRLRGGGIDGRATGPRHWGSPPSRPGGTGALEKIARLSHARISPNSKSPGRDAARGV